MLDCLFFFFEESLQTYHRSLIDKTPKPGKWADLVSCIIRIITTGTLLSATSATSASVGAPVGAAVGAPTSASLMLPLLSLAVSDIGVHYNRKKLTSIIDLLDVYQENKIKIRKNLIEAGILICKSFEIKFIQATAHGSYEFALFKLAHDAVDRAFNYFKKKSSVLDEDFFTPANITKAVILGKSKRHKNIFSIPNRHLGGVLDNGLSTKRLYQETPILKIVDHDENYCYQKKHAQDISDFRLVFDWEEEGNTIQWGIDRKITLFENRQYKKKNCFTATTFNRLSLTYLSEEELEAKKERLFDLVSQHHDASEAALVQRLEEISLYIRDDITESLSNLEKSITDLKVVLLATIESVTVSEARQVDFKRNIGCLKERMFTVMGGELFFESMLARLKDHLATIVTVDDSILYTPLDACYDPATATENRFSLLTKVISYITNPDKKTLLILAEAGSGKTSFSVYLSQYLLKTPLFSTQGYRVLPFYISVPSIQLIKPENKLIERLLKDYHNFNAQEIELLFENKQHIFCFIFDDIDQPNVNFSLIQDLYQKFPASCCIFTACLSRFKLYEDAEKLLMPLNDKKEQYEKTIYIAPFNEVSKKNYIREFLLLKEKPVLSSVYSDVERIYQRIKLIPGLNDLIGQAIFLMMTMAVFPYLEGFYQREKITPDLKHIQKDLLHLYTHLLYTQAADKIKQTKGINTVNGRSIYDCILSYTVNLAELMTATGIKEIDEDLLFARDDSFHAKASSTSDLPNMFLQLTAEQSREYKRCFAKKYDPQLFKDGKDFKSYKYGYQGCVFLHTYGVSASVYHRFRHPKFLDYFCTFNKQRRNKIQQFVDNYKFFNPLCLPKTRRSSNPAYTKLEKTGPFLARQLSSPDNITLEETPPLPRYYSSGSTHAGWREEPSLPSLYSSSRSSVRQRKASSLRSPYSSSQSSVKEGKESSLWTPCSSAKSSIGQSQELLHRRRHHSSHQARNTLLAATTSRVAGRASYFSTMIDPTLDDVTSDAHTAQSGFL